MVATMTVRSEVRGTVPQLRIFARMTGTQTQRTLRVDGQRSLTQNITTAALMVGRVEATKRGLDPASVRVVQQLEDGYGHVALLEGL
jgi:hypothetical protein